MGEQLDLQGVQRNLAAVYDNMELQEDAAENSAGNDRTDGAEAPDSLAQTAAGGGKLPETVSSQHPQPAIEGRAEEATTHLAAATATHRTLDRPSITGSPAISWKEAAAGRAGSSPVGSPPMYAIDDACWVEEPVEQYQIMAAQVRSAEQHAQHEPLVAEQQMHQSEQEDMSQEVVLQPLQQRQPSFVTRQVPLDVTAELQLQQQLHLEPDQPLAPQEPLPVAALGRAQEQAIEQVQELAREIQGPTVQQVQVQQQDAAALPASHPIESALNSVAGSAEGLELRMFTPDTSRRVGLETGDVIVLMLQGRMYTVTQGALPGLNIRSTAPTPAATPTDADPSHDVPLHYVLELGQETWPPSPQKLAAAAGRFRRRSPGAHSRSHSSCGDIPSLAAVRAPAAAADSAAAHDAAAAARDDRARSAPIGDGGDLASLEQTDPAAEGSSTAAADANGVEGVTKSQRLSITSLLGNGIMSVVRRGLSAPTTPTAGAAPHNPLAPTAADGPAAAADADADTTTPAGDEGQAPDGQARGDGLQPFGSGIMPPSPPSTIADQPVIPAECCLEVVRQGTFLGLRSATSGWRFLQPRKRSPHSLVFFNTKCGVWEQWEVVGEADIRHPWSLLPLMLRSRRLPHVTLSVEVARVGAYGPPPCLPFLNPVPAVRMDRDSSAVHTSRQELGLHGLLYGEELLEEKPPPPMSLLDENSSYLMRETSESDAGSLMQHHHGLHNLQHGPHGARMPSAFQPNVFGFRAGEVRSFPVQRSTTDSSDIAHLSEPRYTGGGMALLAEEDSGAIMELRPRQSAGTTNARHSSTHTYDHQAPWGMLQGSQNTQEGNPAESMPPLPVASVTDAAIQHRQEGSHPAADQVSTHSNGVDMGHDMVALPHRSIRSRQIVIDNTLSAESSRQGPIGPVRRTAASHTSHSSYRPASHTSQGGATGELSEDENLRRISGLLVSEWFRFVDVEKNSRRRVEGELAAAIAELRALKLDSLTQVDEIRSQMRGELVGLFRQVQVRDGLLTAAKATRRRALTVAVAALWRRRAQQVQSAVLMAWQGWAQARNSQRAVAESYYQDHLRKRMSAQLQAWSAVARFRAAARRVVVQHVMKVSGRLLAAAWAAWCSWSRRKVQLRVLLVRGIMTTSRRRMGAVFKHWQMTCYQARMARQTLLHIGVRREALLQARVFSAWQGLLAHADRNEQLVQHQLSQTRQKLLQSTFGHWQQELQHKRAKRLRQLQMEVWYERHLQRAAFAGWVGVTEQTKAAASAAAVLAARHAERLQAACITLWQTRLQQQAVANRKVGLLQARQHTRNLQRAFQWWRQWSGARHKTAQAVQQMQAARVCRVQRAVLGAFARHVALQRAQVLAASRHRQRLLARAWCAWWERCAAVTQATKLLAEVPPGMLAHIVADALLVWLDLAQQHTARRQQQLLRMSTSAQASLRVGLGAWWQTHTVTSFSITTAPDTTMPDSSENSQAHSAPLGLASPLGLFALPQATAYDATAFGHKSRAVNGLEAEDMAPVTPAKAVTTSHALSSRSSSSTAAEYRWLLHAVLAGWRQEVASSQQLSTAAGQMQAVLQTRQVGRVLSTWRELCQQSQYAAVQACQHWQATRSQQVLLSWHSITQHRAAQRRLLTCHVFQCQSKQLGTAWQAWRQQCGLISTSRHVAEQRLQVHQQELMRTVLQAWQDAAQGVQRADSTFVDRLSRAELMMQRTRKQQVLRAWHQAAKAVQRAYDDAAAHADLQLLQACFARLQGHAQHQQHKQQQARRAGVWQAQTSVSRAWTAWRQAVAASSDALQLAESAWRRNTQGAVLRCWHQELLDQAAWRQLGARVGRHMSRHRTLTVLHAWLSLCQTKQHSRAQADTLYSSKQHQLVDSCFQGWYQHIHLSLHARKTALQSARKVDQQLLRRTFQGWSAVCAHLHAARQSCEDIACRQQQQLVAAAWEAWQLAVQGAGITSRSVASGQAGLAHAARWGQRRMLERSLRQWLRAVQSKQHKEAFVSAALSRRKVRVQQQVLHMWSMLAALRSSRRLALARHLVRREQHVQRTHLRHWKMVVEETRQRAELLRACIKRKKIAFQQFKTWYWESFDADVQETIRRMFYTTEQALQDGGPSPLDPALMASFQPQGSAAPSSDSARYASPLQQRASNQQVYNKAVEPRTSSYSNHADGRQYSSNGAASGQYTQLQQSRRVDTHVGLSQQQQLQQVTQQQGQRQPVSLRFTTSFDKWAGDVASQAQQGDGARRGTVSSSGVGPAPRTAAPALTGHQQRATHSSEGYLSGGGAGTMNTYSHGRANGSTGSTVDSAQDSWRNVAQNNLFMQQAYDNQLFDDAGGHLGSPPAAGQPSMFSAMVDASATGTTPHGVMRSSATYLRSAAAVLAFTSPAPSLVTGPGNPPAGAAGFQMRNNPGCRLYSDSEDSEDEYKLSQPAERSKVPAYAPAAGSRSNQWASQAAAVPQQRPVGQYAAVSSGTGMLSRSTSRGSSIPGSHPVPRSSMQMKTLADAVASQQSAAASGARPQARPPSGSRP